MRIDVISDTICPWCYVGKRRLQKAIDQRPNLKATVVWHPFQLNPDTPPEGVDRSQYLLAKFGKDKYPKTILEALEVAGKSVGIQFNYTSINRVPNTLDSHRLLSWAINSKQQDQVVDILFRRYFVDGEDIGNHETLVAAAVEAGMNGDTVRRGLSTNECTEVIRTEAEKFRTQGISGVPTFLFAEKYMVQGAQDSSILLDVIDKVISEN